MFRPNAMLLAAVGLNVIMNPTSVLSQNSTKSDAVSTAEFAEIPRSQRPTLAIKDFEFQAQLSRDDQAELNSYASVLYVLRGGNPTARAETNASNLAKSTSQLLTERLTRTGQFRVFEREQLASVTAEQDLVGSARAKKGQDVAQTGALVGAGYVVTGAITKFGKSKKKKGGIIGALVGGAVGVGGISTSHTDYEVGLTVKVIDSSTGEVITSATTEGVVTGDMERKVSALGGTIGTIVGTSLSTSATDEKEKRVTEALQRAIDLVVVQLVDARKRGDLEP